MPSFSHTDTVGEKGRELRFLSGSRCRGNSAAGLMKRQVFLTVQNRGLIAIPADTRRRYGLDQPGVQVEVVEKDGEIVLRPHVPVPSDQAWFWSKKWQLMEREADEEIKAGRVRTSEDVDDFLSELDS